MVPDDRPIEVLSFGESLVDFLPERQGVPLRDVDRFRKVVGGAPTNMALGLARLETGSGLVGKIGDDEFGDFVLESLGTDGVDTRGVVRTDRAQTGVTFVTIEENGDRRFLFYRDPSADMLLRPEDLDRELFREARIVQLGSNLLTEPNVREATEEAIRAARAAGCAISVDPNIRIGLWESVERARDAVLGQIEGASIAKVNEEELELLAPGLDPESAWRDVFAPLGVEIFVVTLGPAGAVLFSGTASATTSARSVDAVDTTGAGDGFMSGFLAALAARLRSESTDGEGPNVEETDDDWTDSIARIGIGPLEAALEVGTWTGTEVCTELGATPALPRLGDLPSPLAATLDS